MIKKDGNVMTKHVFKRNGYVIRIFSVKVTILTKKMAVKVVLCYVIYFNTNVVPVV